MSINNIEVEVRSFITPEKYQGLLDYFKESGEFLGEDHQETYYFDSEQDLRIQKNNTFAKIWLKKGKLHDDYREEIEIKLPREDFDKLKNLFMTLGFKVQIKWFRNRHTFRWQDVNVMVDYTKGYGYIIELEKMADEIDKLQVSETLKEKLTSLGITLTPKEEFDKKFAYYKENWEKYEI
ncbi:MAG: CYTH domain-containing protein [bacterium]